MRIVPAARKKRQVVRSFTRSLGRPLQDSRKFGEEVWARFARSIDLSLIVIRSQRIHRSRRCVTRGKRRVEYLPTQHPTHARRGPKFRFISFKNVGFYVAPKHQTPNLESSFSKLWPGPRRRRFVGGRRAEGGGGKQIPGQVRDGDGWGAAESLDPWTLDTQGRWKILVKKSE